MAALTVQDITTAGVTPTLGAAGASGDTFANDGRTLLWVQNAGSGSITVTINSQTACTFGSTHDKTITVANDEAPVLIGPFPPDRFSNSAGSVEVAYSDTTDITVAAIGA